MIRQDPRVQLAATHRMQAVEAAWSEATMKRKKTGRFNVEYPPEPNPLLRWPSENVPLGSEGLRPSYDKCTPTQFTLGFVANIIEAPDETHRMAMLEELWETLETAETSNWTAAKSAFERTMTKIEAGRLKWTDTAALMHNRFRANQRVLQGQSKGTGQFQNGDKQEKQGRKAPQRRGRNTSHMRQYPCWNFNDGYCRLSNTDHYMMQPIM